MLVAFPCAVVAETYRPSRPVPRTPEMSLTPVASLRFRATLPSASSRAIQRLSLNCPWNPLGSRSPGATS
jgi:hypothetical protein